MNNGNLNDNWLAARALSPRWSIGLSGIVNLIILIIAVFAVWWIFFSNAGIFKLYTPLLGFSIVIWTLLIILWHAELFNFWPFGRNFLYGTHQLAKGAVFTVTTIAVYFIIIFGLVFFVMGNSELRISTGTI